ncbi:LamG-like jellyroll fold domain-containing protein [uncultured Draconibacterium sp.]|uniref:LamG-like jellyroll fold domain-containing protein n=1 Tax=uncultured Draconibacterium sp. TaxID=1573823 RepID=UPI0029C7443D|nr:LamG-like jellyroll fold domain-containing protein [uncultured Draconibacterium sp.]
MIKNSIQQSSRSIIIGVFSLALLSFSIASNAQSYVLKFNASEQESYIDCGTFSDYISGDFTIETWIFVDSWAGNYILADESWNAGSGAAGFAFRLNSNGKVEMNVGTGNWEEVASSENQIQIGKWQHVAVSVNTGNEVKIFVDGILAGNGTLSKPMNVSGSHLFMGEGSAWKERRLDGKLFDFRIWDIARTNEEINSNKDIQLNGNEDGLVANWLLNEGQGDSLNDLTGNHNLEKGSGTSWAVKDRILVDGSLKILNSGKDSVIVSVSGQEISTWKLSENPAVGNVTFKTINNNSAYLIFEAQTAVYQNDTIYFAAETSGGEELAATVPFDLYDNKYQYFGERLLDKIHKDFYNKNNGLYAEAIDASSNFKQATSFVWPASHMLRALIQAWKVNPEKYETLIVNYLAATDQYQVTKDGRTGYAVLPGNDGKRFYDDNGQLMMPFTMYYDSTEDETTLNNLKIAYEFNNGIRDSKYAIPQHEDQLGFGMLFSMSVNYTSYAAAKLYQATNESRYFDEALAYYELENDLSVKIKDSNTKLFNQASYYQNGSWSLNGIVNGNSVRGGGYRAYQTTVVIQNAILLYQITNEQKYLDDAREMMSSCINHWYTAGQGLSEISFWGGDDMIDALLDMYRETKEEEFFTIAADIVDFLSAHNRDKRGYYASSYNDIDGKWNLYRTSENPSEIGMMGQAAAASAFLNVAYNSVNPVTDVDEIEVAQKNQSLTVFPNPAPRGTEMKIKIPEQGGVAGEVYLYNQPGQVVQWFESQEITGDGLITVTPAVNIPGIYFVRVISGAKSYHTKVLIH